MHRNTTQAKQQNEKFLFTVEFEPTCTPGQKSGNIFVAERPSADTRTINRQLKYVYMHVMSINNYLLILVVVI